MTASELQVVNIFDTAITDQELDLVAEVRTIHFAPAMFRRVMLSAKVQGMNRTEGLRYAIALGSLTGQN
jgi:hypothetical protein